MAASSFKKGELARTISAASAPGWDLGEGPGGTIMATKDSGQVGLPWVVLASRGGGGLRVSLYQPGDDLGVEGEELGILSGNPRDMGRQLRDLLNDLELEG